MKITKAIIPIAGLGTRFLPVTKAQPKEMLPLLDKPVIQYVVEEAVASGIKQIFFITSHTKQAVENHFDHNFELEIRLRQARKMKALKIVQRIHRLAEFVIIRQKEPKGSADAILCAREFVRNEPCAVLYGDDIIDSSRPCLRQLMDVFEKYNDSIIAVKRVSKEEIRHFGSIKARKIESRVYQVEKVVEKPDPERAPSNLGIVGRYIFTPDMIQEMTKIKHHKNREIGVTDAFAGFLKKKPMYACEFEGNWYTFGNKQGFLQANIAFGLKDKELGKDLRNFIKRIK